MPKQGYNAITLDDDTIAGIDALKTRTITSRTAVVRDLVYKAIQRKRKQ